MRIFIDGEYKEELEILQGQVFDWWKEQCSKINSADKFVYSVSIDGQVIYDNFDESIAANFSRIDALDIQTITKRESLIETEKSLVEYLNRFIPAISELSGCFYGELTEYHWEKFSYFIEGLSWILQSVEFIQLIVDVEIDPIHILTMQKLESIIKELESSVEEEQYVMIGDLMQYELMPVLENYKRNITLTGELQ
ncbi:hypothetical protein [Paenibacillus bouchesdurhonensis]|uniref:hypothetical protein n=1 Tax=Paenibacillus bouchesdurhonensis TaxID=1870990 RepID=UPI000DA6246B|nr:hypothetical protein [Paenibacillus bouchesdurhonensis]